MTTPQKPESEVPSAPRRFVLGQPKSRLELEDGTLIALIYTHEEDAEFLRDAANAYTISAEPQVPTAEQFYEKWERDPKLQFPYDPSAIKFAEAYAAQATRDKDRQIKLLLQNNADIHAQWEESEESEAKLAEENERLRTEKEEWRQASLRVLKLLAERYGMSDERVTQEIAEMEK